MKSFALLLPLLVTMSTTQHSDAYNLVVDGVDDQLDCTLNGLNVAHFGFGQSGVVALKPKAGPNALVCVPKDTSPPSKHACWAFRYRLFRNWDELLKIQSSCCAPGCPAQPAPIRTDFEAK